jgi:hypothetical protein
MDTRAKWERQCKEKLVAVKIIKSRIKEKE